MRRRKAGIYREGGEFIYRETEEDCGPAKPKRSRQDARDTTSVPRHRERIIYGERANSRKRHKNDRPAGYPDNPSGFAILETAGASPDERERSLRLLKREYVEARRRRGALLPTYEARVYIGLPPSTVGDSSLPSGIPFTRIEGHRLYAKADLVRWEEEHAFDGLVAA